MNYLYNLSHFGGYWKTAKDGVYIETPFAVGEIPLHCAYEEYTENGTTACPSIELETSEFFSVAKVGDRLHITFLLPNVITNWGVDAYARFVFAMTNADYKKRFYLEYFPQSDSINLKTSSSLLFDSWDALLANATANTIVKDGKTIGFTLTGELMDSPESISLVPNFSGNTTNKQEASVTYASYNDLKIVVNPTTEPIDPTALLMGYRVGQMIRGMRNKPKEEL